MLLFTAIATAIIGLNTINEINKKLTIHKYEQSKFKKTLYMSAMLFLYFYSSLIVPYYITDQLAKTFEIGSEFVVSISGAMWLLISIIISNMKTKEIDNKDNY